MAMWKPELSSTIATKHTALLEALKSDLLEGKLNVGDQLPPARKLASALGLAPGTVARVYREATKAGLVFSETGRGTFVASTPNSVLQGSQNYGIIDLSVDHPFERLDPDPGPILEKVARKADRVALMGYQAHEGSMQARSAGAEWLHYSGLHGRAAESVVLCAGSQHGLFVALSSVAQPGQTVFVEALVYPGLREAAALLNLNLVPIAIDQAGLIPESLVEACQKFPQAAALYLVPSLHNPTTSTLPESRREAIAKICINHDIFIVEDDIHRLHSDAPAPPLAEFAPDHTFFIAGLSKTVAPGLRCAYLAPPRQLIQTTTRRVLGTHWTLAPLMAEIATHWIGDGTAARVCEAKSKEAESRQTLVQSLLPEALIHAQKRGSYFWLDLPSFWKSDRFVAAAARRGVAVLSDNDFRIGEGAPTHSGVRVCIGAAPTLQILTTALETLADLLNQSPDYSPGIL